MKIYTIITLTAFLLISCEEPASFNDYLSMAREVAYEIEYTPDIIDEWQLPYETEMLGTGDCEDFVILLIWRVYEKYNVKGSMVVVALEDSYHAIARFDDGLLYDPVVGMLFDLEQFNAIIIYELNFEMLFMIALIKEYEE